MRKLLLLVAFCELGCGDAVLSDGAHDRDLPPRLGQNLEEVRAHATRPVPIRYHGGRVLTGDVHLYYIWYGDWSQNQRAVEILTALGRHIGDSPYFRTNTTYFDARGIHVSGHVTFSGSTVDAYSLGPELRAYSSALRVVRNAIDQGRLPEDEAGVYFVITSADVKVIDFCRDSYAYHDSGLSSSGRMLLYAVASDPTTQCPDWALEEPTPNDSIAADTIADDITHELSEAVTDPEATAWYDRRGDESADKCLYHFGTTYTLANGAKANMRFGGYDFYIEANWVNAYGGRCQIAYP
jgi:hypothetical protein